MRVEHELINVTRDSPTQWSGECRCRRWVVAMCKDRAAVKRAWDRHTTEKGAK